MDSAQLSFRFMRLGLLFSLTGALLNGCGPKSNREIPVVEEKATVLSAPEESAIASDRSLLAATPTTVETPSSEGALPVLDSAGTMESPASRASSSDPTLGYEAWFQRYGLDLSDPKMLEADADGDGYSNRDEFLVDTDPTDASSRPGFHPVMRLSSFKEVDLPLVVKSVDGRRAVVRNEKSDELITVEAGDTLPGTKYQVEQVTEKVESDKFGQMADVSNVTARDPASGELINLMIGMRPRSQDTSAHLTATDDPSVSIEIRQSDEFDWPGAGGGRYLVVDLRQEQAVVKKLDTGEVFTIPLERPKP